MYLSGIGVDPSSGDYIVATPSGYCRIGAGSVADTANLGALQLDRPDLVVTAQERGSVAAFARAHSARHLLAQATEKAQTTTV